MLKIHNLTKIYLPDTLALEKISFKIDPKEKVVISGRSGAGKTTLLKILYCLIRPTSGQVLFEGKDIGSLPERKREELRRRTFGMIFQDKKLLENRTVKENILLPLYLQKSSRREKKEGLERVADLLRIGHIISKYVRNLSEGQKQKVAIARAIITRPRILLADEPTSNLDPASKNEIIDILDKIHKTGTTLIIASHDLETIERFQTRTLVLENGRIIKDELVPYLAF